MANHAIFVSPLLTPTQAKYTAYETQAIGRIRRYGQEKHVNVIRLLTLDTIDVQIYKERSGKDPKQIDEELTTSAKNAVTASPKKGH